MFEDLKPQNKNQKFPPKADPPLAEEIKKLEIEGKKGGAEDIFKDVENKNKPFLKGVEQSDEHGARKPKFERPSNKRKFIFIGISIAIVLFIILFFILLNMVDKFSFSRIFFFSEEEEEKNRIKNQELRIKNGEEGEEWEEGEQKLDPSDERGAGIGNWKLGNGEEGEESWGDKVEIRNLKLEIKDTDGDGLSDEDEERLGTSVYKVDTDGDGLSDREEIMVYKTDPLNPDSDQDGYLDGGEVSVGYNPKGEGKLYGGDMTD